MRPIHYIVVMQMSKNNCDGSCFQNSTKKRLRFCQKLRNARSVISMFRIKTQQTQTYPVHNDIKYIQKNVN
jgi:hypothetical protein